MTKGVSRTKRRSKDCALHIRRKNQQKENKRETTSV